MNFFHFLIVRLDLLFIVDLVLHFYGEFDPGSE